ncbi:NADH-ubiquinone oxidoreductase chain 5, partial [Trachymyrmex zeteki]
DGLGITSYCLIIYYHNYTSYNSAIVTVLCNRLEDVGILITLRLIITEAPTPVSALVHSSTLVTAGVYLIIRFQKFLMSTNINTSLCFISVTTIFMAGLIANFENDFKKIIALSTLRQLGLIIMILRIGQCILAFYHLLTHAIFKSILFMAAGTIIHSISNNQDIRMLGNLNESIPFTIISLIISNLALGGAPFFSGFYRKDLIIEYAYSNRNTNILITIIIIISLILTITYSIRFSYYLFFNKTIKFYRHTFLKENFIINLSIIIIILLRVSIGSLINWAFFFDLYLIFINTNKKLITLIFSLARIIIIVLVLSIICKLIKLNDHCCCMPYYLIFVSSI